MDRFEKSKTANGRRPINSGGADFRFDGDQLSLDSREDNRAATSGAIASLTKRQSRAASNHALSQNQNVLARKASAMPNSVVTKVINTVSG